MQLMELISEVERVLSDEERASDLAFEESRKIIRKTNNAASATIANIGG